jgi:hypothetical protein
VDSASFESDELKRLIAALAATRNKPDRFDYVLIDADLLLDEGFQLQQCIGETADELLNERDHFDAHQLTATDLLRLTRTFHEWVQERPAETVIQKQISLLIRQSIEAHWIDPELVKSGILQHLR